MTLKIKVRQGGLSGAATKDFTSQVPVFDESSSPQLSAGMMFGEGHGCQSDFLLDDPTGEIPNLGVAQIEPHNVVWITEDAPGYEAWLCRGRAARDEAGRAYFKLGAARQFSVIVEDGNVDLRGLDLTESWSRPAETATARAIAVIEAFCQGSPRLTTNIVAKRWDDAIDPHLVKPHPTDGEVMMPATVYPATTAVTDIIQECAETEGQNWGVVLHHLDDASHLCFLWTEEDDWVTYPCPLTVTDDDPDLVTEFPPIWDQGAAVVEEGQDVLSAVVTKWGTGEDGFAFAERPANIERYDYWVEKINDATSASQAQADLRAPHLLAGQANKHVTHQLSILLPASMIDQICAGMSIPLRAAASRSSEAVGGTVTRRIAQVKWEPVSPKVSGNERLYLAHLQLTRPLKIARQRRPEVKPKPPSGPGSPALVGSFIGTGSSSDLSVAVSGILDSHERRALIAFTLHQEDDATSNASVDYDADGTGLSHSAQSFTKLGERVVNFVGAARSFLAVWILLDPDASIANARVRMVDPVNHINGMAVRYVTGVDAVDPVGTVAQNGGTGTTSSLSIVAGSGDLILDAGGVLQVNATVADPIASGSQSNVLTEANDSSFGTADLMLGASAGDATPTWTFPASYQWLSIGLAVKGTPGDTTSPIGGNDEGDPGDDVGTQTPINHVHAHSDLSAKTSETHHHAESVEVTPFSTIAATNVQAALAEIVAETTGGTHPNLATHDSLGLATDAELAAHAAAVDPHTGYQKESEKGVASGYASLGAGALVPMAQLATGTPDGTKFVRDDGTLVVPAGGGGGMTNPMTAVGDIIKGGTAGAAGRLAIGTAGQVLKVVSGAPAWAAESGGGGGFTLIVNESGSSFAGFTAHAGTWASDAGVIKQTNPAASVFRARYDTRIPTSHMIVQFEAQFPAGGVGTRGAGVILGWPGTNVSNYMLVQLLRDTTDTFNIQQDALANIVNDTVTLANDTWYKVTVRVSYYRVDGYLDGTFIGTANFGGGVAALTANHVAHFVGLRAFDGPVWFRNFKVWVLTLPS